MRWAGVLAGLLLLTTFIPLSIAQESSNFSQTVEAGTYSGAFTIIGVEDMPDEGDETAIVLVYPADNQGQDVPLNNTSGPYPVVFFFVDDGEGLDNYDWLARIAEAGYILVIVPDSWNAQDIPGLVDGTTSMMEALTELDANGSDDGSLNMKDAFDLDHWGVAGHGTGGMLAAVVNSWWSNLSTQEQMEPPRSLFALGIDISEGDVSRFAETVAPADPAFALFLTGTADGIAPASEHLDKVLENWQGGWHRMAPVGANHLQYEDESDWWEFGDETATMSKEEQQAHAFNHILPYLDLTLKGDYSVWVNASNRDVDPSTISDPDAYVSEDLNASRLLKVESITEPKEELVLGESADLRTNLSHRDGSNISSEMTEAWCVHWDGSIIQGIFYDDSDVAQCTIESELLVPGPQSIIMYASWKGMQTYSVFNISRGNSPVVAVEPTPAISLLQHGSTANLTPGLFAEDPDGQPIVFSDAILVGEGSDNLTLTVDQDNIRIFHTGEAEWDGTVGIDIEISESTVEPTSVNISTTVTVVPVDDRVVENGSIPQQSFSEDSNGTSLDLSQWFTDPEGSELVVVGSSNDANISITWKDGMLHIDSAVNWSGAAIINISVSDGSTDPVWETFPLRVDPIDDPPVLVVSNLSMEEDDVLQVPLSSIGWDSDGDQLTWNLSSDCLDSNVSPRFGNGLLVIEPAANWNGLDECWNIHVDDGVTNLTQALIIEVSPVDDAPAVSWHQPEFREDGNLSLGYTLFDDDEPESHLVDVAWREGEWMRAASPACLEWTDGALACTILLEPVLSTGSTHPMWLRLESEDVLTEVQRLEFESGDDQNSDAGESVEEVVSMFDDIKMKIAAGAVIFLLLVAFLGNLRRSTTTTVVEQVFIEADVEEDEVIIIDEEDEPAPSGLLDLARRRG